QQTAKRPRLHYGWIVVLGCTLMMGTSYGLFYNCNSVFVKPVCEDLGFARGPFTLYTTIVNFVSMFTQIVYGELYRKHRVIPFTRGCSVVIVLSILGYSFSTKLWHFYLFGTIQGLTLIPLASLSIAQLVNHWFADKRGLATGIAVSGSGITAALITPVLTRVVAEVSWRAGFRMLAAIGAALLFVSTFLLLREKPSDLGMLPYGLKTDAAAGGDAAPVQLPEAVGLTRAEALRTPALWLHVLGFFIILLCGMGVNPHIISYLTDIGYSEGLASTVVSLVMTCMIFAKISMGALFDKIGAVWASVFVGCCVILSMAALALCPLSPVMPYAFAFFFGFAYSIGSVTQPFLCSENYGQKEFSAIYSLAAMLSGVLSSIGPTLIGSMYDSFGSYAKVWPILAVLGAVATVSLTASSLLARKNGYNPNRIGAKKK
ncbi:MAG: MFS transporter, partial [Clostridia bacterium]|nr:MFS transporter [Clostridia bacterium]